MRLHPKSRASTDHKPGPNMASALAMVPNSRATHRSPGTVRNCQVSIKATDVPTSGVHSPGTMRIPHPADNPNNSVVPIGVPPSNILLARANSAAPTTKRMRSRAAPGRPPAKVEYKRRKYAPFKL